MSLTVNLRPKIHRKQWEPIFTQTPVAVATGCVFCAPTLPIPPGDGNQAYYIAGTSSIFQFAQKEEAFGQIPNSGSAGSFGAGCAMFWHPSGPTGTASAGTTTTLTTTSTINRDLRGYRMRITGGTNKGGEYIIKSNTWGANAVITIQDTLGAAFDNTSVYLLLTGHLWLYVPGGTSGFNYYDWALNTWTSRSIASGPAVTSNEGCLIGPCAANCPSDLGTASAGAATTLTDSSRNWPVNIWTRSMVVILSGTGVGQYRYISSNTSTVLTVDTAWGTNPDNTSVYYIFGQWADVASAGSTTTITAGSGTPWTASQWINYQVRAVAGTGAGQVAVITANTTSQLTFGAVGTGFDATTRYVIEGDDNALYFLGGTAVTLFKYSISGNTWSTVTPGVARAGAPAAGASGTYIGSVFDSLWMGVGAVSAGGPNGIKCNGRYIYSFRGGTTGTLDVYDIAAVTWVSAFSYSGASNETFQTGTTYADLDGVIYLQKDATGRFFRFEVARNEMIPWSTNNTTQGAAIDGARMIVMPYFDPTNGKKLRFIYWMLNTSSFMYRILEIARDLVAPMWNGF